MDTAEVLPTVAKSTSSKAVVATVIGNALEIFDLIIFAQFAVLIGRTFFPSYSDYAQIMFTLATYGVGYLVRPLGAFYIGAYADRVGRKAALTLTISLMAVGTAITGLTPSFNTIGITAPLMVFVARLLCGFSAGGELGAATTYLLEMAPTRQRGLYASWQFASQGIGIFLGGLVGLALSTLLTAEDLQSWGWRIPFVLGTLIAPIGVYIRNQLDETIDLHASLGDSRTVFKEIIKNHKFDILWGTLAFVGPTTSSYIISTYMTTYALTVLKLSTTISMSAGIVAGSTTIVAALIGGHLADRFGRRIMTVVPEILLLVLIYPVFQTVVDTRTGTALLAAISGMTFIRMMVSASLASQVPEAFPKPVRTTGMSICYSLATTIFGGSAQAIVTWLINYTGNPQAPAVYLIGTGILTLTALLMLKTKSPQTPLETQ